MCCMRMFLAVFAAVAIVSCGDDGGSARFDESAVRVHYQQEGLTAEKGEDFVVERVRSTCSVDDDAFGLVVARYQDAGDEVWLGLLNAGCPDRVARAGGR